MSNDNAGGGGGNTWDWDEGIREVHSDNEDGAGGGVTGGVGGGVDAEWANFDSFRKQEPKPQGLIYKKF